MNVNAKKKLESYGDRGEKFKTYFKDCLKDSKNTTKDTIQEELFKQLRRENDARSAIKAVANVIEKRTASVGRLCESLSGQMERLMVLWDYEDMGYSQYRISAIGENCEDCQSIDGEIFKITDAVIGKTLAPFHPNCNCAIEILDEAGNVVFTITNTNPEDEDEKPWEKYLKSSLKQLILGNYTDDVNLLGTLLQAASGILGVDLPADVRDLFYDITNFELSKEHISQTLLDSATLLPLVGGVKYADEAGAVIKAGVKHGDEAVGVIQDIAKYNDEAALIQELESKGTKFSKKDIIFITKDKIGQTVWLEQGMETAGFKHIIDKHGLQFNAKGISNDEIPNYIMEAVQHGKIVGYQRTRTIYEFIYNGKTHHVAVQIGYNGFIVGANPKSVKGGMK